MYGLEERLFAGILDNSPLKHGKRLYGCGLMCRKPADVVLGRGPSDPPLRVFLNIGCYNEEVRAQLVALNEEVECIVL